MAATPSPGVTRKPRAPMPAEQGRPVRMRVAINLLPEDPKNPSGAHWFWTRVIPEMAKRLESGEELHLLVSPKSRHLAASQWDIPCPQCGGPLEAQPRPVRRQYGSDHTGVVTGEYRFGDTRHILSDISALQALGWEPRHAPTESVAAYAASLKGSRCTQGAALQLRLHQRWCACVLVREHRLHVGQPSDEAAASSPGNSPADRLRCAQRYPRRYFRGQTRQRKPGSESPHRGGIG
jgi:hypothetical protein